MRTWFIALLALLLAACTSREAIESLTSPEDRAFATEMVDRLRQGDAAWLQARFSPDLWAQSEKQLAQVPALFPARPGETRLSGFEISTDFSGTERKTYRLVTSGDGRWTSTRIETLRTEGREQVVSWNVTPSDQPPAELVLWQSWDDSLRWLRIAGPIALLAVIGLIVWLVRRSRRGGDPLMGNKRA